MALTKRGRKALKAILSGQEVSFAGWPAGEALEVLDAALAEVARIREDGRRKLAQMEALVKKAEAGLQKLDESIDRLLEARAQAAKVASLP